MSLSTIEEAVQDLRAGKFVIVIDDEERENEGDLVIAAEKVTPEAINYMARHARGLICISLTAERVEQLGIPMMPRHNSSPLDSPFTVSVEARSGVTTGISSMDRAETVRVLIDPDSGPQDISYPGHVFPLRARSGGTLVRAGHTEASIDLATLAGLYPGAVICEIMNDDGTMARLPDLQKMASRTGIRIVSVEQLIRHRQRHETLVQRVAEARLPTRYGEFRVVGYRGLIEGDEHLALVRGDITNGNGPVLVRVHSECLTGDVFESVRCDCGEQVRAALQMIAEEGRGILLYLRQEGRGIGLHKKIEAYALQDRGLDTVEANIELGFPVDLRNYDTGAQILRELGVREVKLLTSNPEKVSGLNRNGLRVVETVPVQGAIHPENIGYLETKRRKMGHLIDAERGHSQAHPPLSMVGG